MIFDIQGAEEKIGYSFKDKMLLRKCFTHSSYSNENKNAENNEVLEFFGDAILDFAVTEYLCANCEGDEGVLTKKRADIVSKEPLQEAVFAMDLAEYMLFGKGVARNSDFHEKMYSSLFEAIVAGIYIDGGMAPTKKFIREKLLARHFAPPEKKTAKKSKARAKDGKSECQEFVQKYKLGDICYDTLEKTGPDHAPHYKVAFLLNGKKVAAGEGGSKKAAEMAAAENALAVMQKKIKGVNKPRAGKNK